MAREKVEITVIVTSSPDGDHARENIPVEIEFRYWGQDFEGEKVYEVTHAWWEGGIAFTKDQLEAFDDELNEALYNSLT